MLLIIVVILAGLVASVAPTVAASHGPTHSAPGYVLDDQPIPTPTPILQQPNEVCDYGC